MLKEHDVVTITTDLPNDGLSAGDVGAVVHCYSNRNVYEVEVIDANGRSRSVVTVTGDHLLRLNVVSLVA